MALALLMAIAVLPLFLRAVMLMVAISESLPTPPDKLPSATVKPPPTTLFCSWTLKGESDVSTLLRRRLAALKLTVACTPSTVVPGLMRNDNVLVLPS